LLPNCLNSLLWSLTSIQLRIARFSHTEEHNTFSVRGELFATNTAEQVLLTPHPRTETDPGSVTLCPFMFSRVPCYGYKLKASNSECYTSSSGPFRIYHYKLIKFTITFTSLE
jgi:hypothetical protein